MQNAAFTRRMIFFSLPRRMLRQMHEASGGTVRMLTIAPELNGSIETIAEATNAWHTGEPGPFKREPG